MKKSFLILTALIFAFAPTATTFALSEQRWDFYDTNNIYYYNPENLNCDSSDSKISSDGSDLSIIGDSITAGSIPELKKVFPKLQDAQINAKVGRHWDEGLNELSKMELKKHVIFALGTNDSTITQTQLDAVFNRIGPDKNIILTTNHTLQRDYSANNNLFKANAESKANVYLADWQNAIKSKESEFLTSDGIHPNTKGKQLFAETLHSTLNPSGDSNHSSDSSSQNNKLYNGDPVFSEAELQKIKENQPFYQKSAEKYQFPWQILAVMHRREHGLAKDNPSNGQGAYQLYSYTGGGSNSKAFLPAGKISDQEFQRQTDIAAQLIKENYGKNLNFKTDDDVKTLFFRYNGAATTYKAQARSLGFSVDQANRGEGSPYVMNLADAKRDPRKNPNWKMITKDGGSAHNSPHNITPGAFVMYAALGGSSGLSDCGPTSEGNKDVNQTAIELAWPTKGHSLNNPKPAYKEALSKVKLNTYGDQFVRIGASCDAFVATVMRFSGTDPDFPCCGAASQLRYLQNSSKYVEVPNHPGSLKPGDIRSSSGHIEIYVEVDGVGKIASASHRERTAEIGNFYNNAPKFKAFRLK